MIWRKPVHFMEGRERRKKGQNHNIPFKDMPPSDLTSSH
jgi:hypothetical protein